MKYHLPPPSPHCLFPIAYSELYAQVSTSDTYCKDQGRQDVLCPPKDQWQIQHSCVPSDPIHGRDCISESAGNTRHCNKE